MMQFKHRCHHFLIVKIIAESVTMGRKTPIPVNLRKYAEKHSNGP